MHFMLRGNIVIPRVCTLTLCTSRSHRANLKLACTTLQETGYARALGLCGLPYVLPTCAMFTVLDHALSYSIL